MTPTLVGRIQSRLVLVLTVGGIWTFVAVPFIPRPPEATIGNVYGLTYIAVFIATFFGLLWELVYHGVQQLRWEKTGQPFLGF